MRLAGDASAGDDDVKERTGIEIARVIGNLWSRQTWAETRTAMRAAPGLVACFRGSSKNSLETVKHDASRRSAILSDTLGQQHSTLPSCGACLRGYLPYRCCCWPIAS
jgi:hypothetical protein